MDEEKTAEMESFFFLLLWILFDFKETYEDVFDRITIRPGSFPHSLGPD